MKMYLKKISQETQVLKTSRVAIQDNKLTYSLEKLEIKRLLVHPESIQGMQEATKSLHSLQLGPTRQKNLRRIRV